MVKYSRGVLPKQILGFSMVLRVPSENIILRTTIRYIKLIPAMFSKDFLFKIKVKVYLRDKLKGNLGLDGNRNEFLNFYATQSIAKILKLLSFWRR